MKKKVAAPPPVREILGLREFRATNEYTELDNHRKALLKFYASDAFRAQQAFLETSKAMCANVALKMGRTVEERERARSMYQAFEKLIELPDFIFGALSDEVPAEKQE